MHLKVFFLLFFFFGNFLCKCLNLTQKYICVFSGSQKRSKPQANNLNLEEKPFDKKSYKIYVSIHQQI